MPAEHQSTVVIPGGKDSVRGQAGQLALSLVTNAVEIVDVMDNGTTTKVRLFSQLVLGLICCPMLNVCPSCSFPPLSPHNSRGRLLSGLDGLS